MAKKTSKTSVKSASKKKVDNLNKKIEQDKKPKAEHNPPKTTSPKVMDITPVKKPEPKSTPIKEPEAEQVEAKKPEPESTGAKKTEKTAKSTKVESIDDIEIVEVHDNTVDEPTEEVAEESAIEDKTPVEDEITPEADLEATLASFAEADPAIVDNVTDNEKTNAAALAALERDSEPKSTPVAKPAKRQLRIFPRLMALVVAGTLGYLTYLIIKANVLPVLHLSLLIAGVSLYCLFSLFKNFRKKTRTPVIVILTALNLLLTGASIFGIFKINDTLNFFDKTLSQPDKQVSIYNVIVKKSSPKSSLTDVADKVIHAQRDLTLDSSVIIDAVKTQAKASIAFSDNLDYLVNLVTVGDVSTFGDSDDPIIMIHSGTYDGIVSDNQPFADKTKIIGEIKVEIDVERSTLDNITTKPFLIYISGIDTRTGTMPARSLSDVNMVAVVNPTNRHLLLVSTPRDYYVHIAGTPKGALPDKLTHAGGAGGVQLSMATLSELFDINIDQYVRVNFNFVQNLVDAIGGINIYNDQKYSFSCWTNRKCVFQPGYNYVSGDCALAFARERHAYEQGDRHRGENQQQVIKLVLDKVTSSSTLISRYSEILDSLVGTFETTLTQENIIDLVKMHVSDMTAWTVENYNLDGKTGMAPTYTYPSQNLSIMYPNETTVEIAKHKIAAAMGTESEEAAQTAIDLLEGKTEDSENTKNLKDAQ